MREIDTLVYPETVEISPSEAAALFDQFDQSEPPTKESPQDHTLNDRIFRVAFYEKDPVNPEESEPDEIDIPINASVISTSEKMPEAPPSDVSFLITEIELIQNFALNLYLILGIFKFICI